MSGRAGDKGGPALADYFRHEWRPLALVCVTGIVYNVGLAAGPWFEGWLAQCLADVVRGTATPRDMYLLAAAYVLVTLVVQGARFLKRLYVRVFANNVDRRMKCELFARVLRTGRAQLAGEGAGALMTKAVSDVDDCAEGMRKFTTEVFDTGVALASYVVTLVALDWRLALLAMAFSPLSYAAAELLKRRVTAASAEAKASMGRLGEATLDRVSGAVSYRVFGLEGVRDGAYEGHAADYERAATRAGLWTGALRPLYQAVSMLGVAFVIVIGARNVLGVGWAAWDIAGFTTFMATFARLATKSSHAAKLFNAVQRARVSWERIRGYLGAVPVDGQQVALLPTTVEVSGLTVAFAQADSWSTVLDNVSFTVPAGTITGVTGEVACGKSTLGRAFLGEWADDPGVRVAGSVRLGQRDLLARDGALGAVGYLGHDPELLTASVEQNVMLGEDGDCWPALAAACIDDEVRDLPDGEKTLVGVGGVRLSGGQQARLALARTLAHPRPVMVLDDPFASVDKGTEARMLANLRAVVAETGCGVVLISHRIAHFADLDQVVFLEGGRATVGSHAELAGTCPGYRHLCDLQLVGGESRG